MDNKTTYRLIAKNIRKSLNIEEISNILVKKIQDNPVYINSQHVMIYYPTKFEFDFLDLLKDNKSFYLPKVIGEDLLVCEYTNNLILSNLNIFEPDTTSFVNPQKLDLIITPALMIDKLGYRLGYGKGFYDRFLSKYPNINTLVAISKELIVEKLPYEKTDIPIKNVITY